MTREPGSATPHELADGKPGVWVRGVAFFDNSQGRSWKIRYRRPTGPNTRKTEQVVETLRGCSGRAEAEAVQRSRDAAAFAERRASSPPGDGPRLVVPEEAPAPAGPMLSRLVCLADVEPQPVQWLWPGRIAVGKLTMLAGDPGLGKSLVTTDIAARVSRGNKWPDGSANGRPGGVVIMNAEDELGDTVRPRLDAAGADVRRIAALAAVRVRRGDGVGERTFSLQTDLKALEEAIVHTPECQLVIIDPVSAYLGSGVDSHNNAEVRTLLTPLTDLASRHGVAVLCVTHLNKSSGGPALYRATGSLAFVAAARAAWVVAKDRDNAQRRLFLPMKNNLGPDVQGLAFSVEPSATPAGSPTVAWEKGAVSVDANDALSSEDTRREGGAKEEATEWLREVLAGGPKSANELKAMARESALSWRTVQYAQNALGIITKGDGFGRPRIWRLPESSSAPRSQGPENSAHMGADGVDQGAHDDRVDAEERAAIAQFGGG